MHAGSTRRRGAPSRVCHVGRSPTVAAGSQRTTGGRSRADAERRPGPPCGQVGTGPGAGRAHDSRAGATLVSRGKAECAERLAATLIDPRGDATPLVFCACRRRQFCPPRSLFHTSFSPVSASKVPEWISGGFAGSAAASSIWAVDHSKGVVQVEANDGVAFTEYRRRCESLGSESAIRPTPS